MLIVPAHACTAATTSKSAQARFRLDVPCDQDGADVVLGTVRYLWDVARWCRADSDCDTTLHDVECVVLEETPVSSAMYERTGSFARQLIADYCRQCDGFGVRGTLFFPGPPEYRCMDNKCHFLRRDVLDRGCREGRATDCARLGTYYSDGRLAEPNSALSRKYFRRACDLGDRESCDHQ
jgi:hypothetical protein